MTARRFAPGVRPALVNGAAGVVAFDGGRPFAVLAFTVVDERAVTIDVFNDLGLVGKLDIPGITASGASHDNSDSGATSQLVHEAQLDRAAAMPAPSAMAKSRGPRSRRRYVPPQSD